MAETPLTSLAGRLRKLLPDDFSRSMLDASLHAIDDPANPLRPTFFSVGIREMVGHMLHLMAPDQSVAACSWFIREHETITRRQRAKYLVQGGLSDSFLESVQVDMATLYDAVRPRVDALSKYVHVREATFTADSQEIENLAVETLAFLIDLLEAISTCRERVTDALEEALHDEAVMAMVTENFDHVDVLSSTHSIENVYVLSKTVSEIGAEIIRFRITGEVEMDFHWGPSHDGIDGSETFPFELTMWAFVDDLQRFEDIEVVVDDSNWQAQFGPDIEC